MLHIHLWTLNIFLFFFFLFVSSIFLISTHTRKKSNIKPKFIILPFFCFTGNSFYISPLNQNECFSLFSKANQIKWNECYTDVSWEYTRSHCVRILLFCIKCTLYDLGSCSIQFNWKLERNSSTLTWTHREHTHWKKRHKFPFARIIHKLKHHFQVAHTYTLAACCLLACLTFLLKLFTIIARLLQFFSRILSLYHINAYYLVCIEMTFSVFRIFLFSFFTLILIRFYWANFHFFWYTQHMFDSELNWIEYEFSFNWFSLQLQSRLCFTFTCLMVCVCVFWMSYPLIRFHFRQGFFLYVLAKTLATGYLCVGFCTIFVAISIACHK